MFATTLTAAASSQAPAGMVSTTEVLAAEQVRVDRDQLKSMLGNDEVKQKLADLGVDPAQIENRINSLTAAELADFNQQLDEAPAAAGVGGAVGIIVFFLLVFIVTDMLCATDIYSFVNCIN
tara:strand:+ start:252 stop:617 length:366 start_codon:yes stop_codon:yes gene_type:complete